MKRPTPEQRPSFVSQHYLSPVLRTTFLPQTAPSNSRPLYNCVVQTPYGEADIDVLDSESGSHVSTLSMVNLDGRREEAVARMKTWQAQGKSRVKDDGSAQESDQNKSGGKMGTFFLRLVRNSSITAPDRRTLPHAIRVGVWNWAWIHGLSTPRISWAGLLTATKGSELVVIEAESGELRAWGVTGKFPSSPLSLSHLFSVSNASNQGVTIERAWKRTMRTTTTQGGEGQKIRIRE